MGSEKRKSDENGGRLPLGYKRGTDGQILIDKEEAAIVCNIYKARLQGATLKEIAEILNNFGVKTRRGKKWYPSSISIILKNEEKYRGCLRNDNEYGIKWPKILIYVDEVEEEESESDSLNESQGKISSLILNE